MTLSTTQTQRYPIELKALERDMSDQPENPMPVFLRRLDTKMDRVLEEIQDLKPRMTIVGLQVSQQVSTGSSHYVSLAVRLDRIEGRLDRLVGTFRA